MQLTNRIAGNVFWQLLDRVSRVVSGFVVFAIASRALTGSDFGRMSLAIALVSIFTPLASLSIERIAVKLFLDRPLERQFYVGKMLQMRLWSSSFAYVCAIVSAYFLYGMDIVAVICIFGLVPVLQSYEIADCLYQSDLRVALLVPFKIFAQVASVAIRLFLYKFDAGLELFLLSYLIDGALLGFLFRRAVRRHYDLNLIPSRDARAIKEIFSECWPLIGSSFLYMLYMRIPQIMLGKLYGYELVAIYTVAIRLIEGGIPVLQVVSSSFYPSLIKSRELALSDFWNYYKGIANAVSMVALIPLLILFSLSDFVVSVLFGSAYIESASVLRLLIPGLYCMVPTVMRAGYLISINRKHDLMKSSLYGALFSIPISYVLIDMYGIEGAAISFSLVQFISLIAYDLFHAELRGLGLVHLRALGGIGFMRLGKRLWR